MDIGRPEVLWLLWLVPGLIALAIWSARRRAVLLARFAEAALLKHLVTGVSSGRRRAKTALVILSVAALVLALCELRVGYRWEEMERKGVDLVVALDVSDSMLVQDAAGDDLSRLSRARREIRDLLRLLQGDRVGLVAFAGAAFLECPLTLDYGAAELFLSGMDTDSIPIKGTAIGEAVRASLAAFEGGRRQSQAIILITDGEDHSGEALTAAKEAAEQGVRVFTIGIGKPDGSPIPAEGGGFRRDARGELVLSRLDEPTLQKLALETGGRYVRSVSGDLDLETIYHKGIKATLEDQELTSVRRQRWTDRFQWLIGLALLLLVVEPFISERSRRTG